MGEKDKDSGLNQLNELLKQAGAGETTSSGYGQHGPTMTRLLQQYSKCAFLTETDEDGEHPLFPTKKDQGLSATQVSTRMSHSDFLPEDSSTTKGATEFEILSYLDRDKIPLVKDEFFRNKNELNLEQFVYVMKKNVSWPEEEMDKLVAQLINLFELIDIDGSNVLDWEDFTTFLVDQGMTEDVVRQFNIIWFSRSTCQDEISPHQSHIEKAFYFKHYDKIAFFEQGSRYLKLYTPDFAPFKELKDHAASLLTAEYIDKHKYIAVSCSDLTLSFYDVDNNWKLVRRFNTRTSQLVMCWSEVGQILFSADHEGGIYAWDMNRLREPVPDVKNADNEASQRELWQFFINDEIRKRGPMRHIEHDDTEGDFSLQHNRNARRHRVQKLDLNDANNPNSGGTIVMMLLELPVLAQMASCGVDKNVMIWDVFQGTPKKTLKGHEMGVRAMAFAPSSKVLVTGGFDYNLFVWNPYVGKSIHIIHGHNASIVGIEVLGTTSNQVVSADAEGVMKTWDLSNYSCLQTIFVEDIPHMRSFISVPSHKRIIAAGRKFVAYDYQHTGLPDQTDEAPIIKAFYNSRLKVFITGCTTHLRIWDAVSGSIKCVIPHHNAEISDFCVDDRGRKVFISDHKGEIWAYNSTTGCFIKKLTKHNEEVSGMIYCRKDKNILTVSWDRSIAVHGEASEHPRLWRSASNIHGGDITCVAFSRHLGLIATGSTDSVVSLREYERLRLVAPLLGHKADITCLTFLDPFPLLVSADFNGNIAIWVVSPTHIPQQHKHANSVLTRFINMQSLENAAPVNCLGYRYEKEEGHLYIYTGDEDGDIRVWEISRMLQVGNVTEVEAKREWEPHRKDHFDAKHLTEVHVKRATASPELPCVIKEPVVRQSRTWKGHDDSVRSIQVCQNPLCVVTAGYDHMVKIWSYDGEPLSILRAYGQSSWNFDVQADLSVDEETLRNVLAKVEALEEGDKIRDKRKMASRSTVADFDVEKEVQNIISKNKQGNWG